MRSINISDIKRLVDIHIKSIQNSVSLEVRSRGIEPYVDKSTEFRELRIKLYSLLLTSFEREGISISFEDNGG